MAVTGDDYLIRIAASRLHTSATELRVLVRVFELEVCIRGHLSYLLRSGMQRME